jgi:lipid-binding SYLF domain-containing protein
MLKTVYAAMLVAMFSFGMLGCSTTPTSDEKRDSLDADVSSTLGAMKADSPEFASFLARGYAYAVFPSLGEGAFIVGGGGGRGEVFKQGQMIGYSTMKKVSVGAQAGGQEYSQVIVFENEAALSKFVNQEYKFGANATAVALKSGVAANAKFQDGVAVFQHTKGGLMAAAAVGGQTFNFAPKGQ